MKRTIMLLMLILPISILSQIPQTITWQGIIQDANGTNLDGNYNITVKLFELGTGGTEVWTEIHNSVLITDGVANLSLGSVTPFNLSFDKQYWLEIKVGNGTAMPRIKLAAVPYALSCKEIDPTWDGSNDSFGNIYRNGNVGIGIISPINNLHLSSSSVFTGLRLTNAASGETSSDGLLLGMQFQDDAPTNRYGLIRIYEDIPMYIKTGSFGASSDQLTLLPNGNIGIGTSTPSELVHILNGEGSAKIRLSGGAASLAEITFYNGSTYQGAIGFNNSNDYLYIYEGGNIYFKSGRIGIQSVSAPTYAIQLPNSTSNGTGKAQAYQWVTYSDGRLKTDKKEISYGLNDIMQIEPLSYFHHNSEFEKGSINILSSGTNDIGFVAQDIYKIIPEIVSVPENEKEELWGINYEKLTPILVKAVQEQQAIIENQNKKIEELEKKIDFLMKNFNSNK